MLCGGRASGSSCRTTWLWQAWRLEEREICRWWRCCWCCLRLTRSQESSGLAPCIRGLPLHTYSLIIKKEFSSQSGSVHIEIFQLFFGKIYEKPAQIKHIHLQLIPSENLLPAHPELVIPLLERLQRHALQQLPQLQVSRQKEHHTSRDQRCVVHYFLKWGFHRAQLIFSLQIVGPAPRRT